MKEQVWTLVSNASSLSQLASTEASLNAMASSHSSPPVPRPGAGGRDRFYRKERDPSPPRCRPIRSLPDVCPKEPMGKTCCS